MVDAAFILHSSNITVEVSYKCGAWYFTSNVRGEKAICVDFI